MTDQIREFEAWWESDGKYCRAGGGDYERTFAYEAWQAASAALAQQPAAAAQEPVAVVDANDDSMWADILPDVSVKVGDLLYTAPPAAEQPVASAQLASIAAMCQMIEDREWAEHVGVGEVGRRVESALTALHNELLEAQRQAAAEQPVAEECPQCAGTGYDCPDCIAAAEHLYIVPTPRELLHELRAFTLEYDSGKAGVLRGLIDKTLRQATAEKCRDVPGKEGDA